MPVQLDTLGYLCTLDPDNGPWALLLPSPVPHQLQQPDIISRLSEGAWAQAHPDGVVWYRCERMVTVEAQLELQRATAAAIMPHIERSASKSLTTRSTARSALPRAK